MNEKEFNATASEVARRTVPAGTEIVGTFFDPLKQTAERVEGLFARVEALHARLCGTSPDKPSARDGSGSGGIIRGVPSGLFEEIADGARTVNAQIERIYEMISDIQRRLP